MKCLVIGGAGFIGSHLVDALVDRGHSVRIIDDFSTGTLANLALSRERIELFFGDLRSAAFLREVMQGVTYVFHQASSQAWESGGGEEEAPQANVVGNITNVLREAREAGVRRLIFASSCEVYGRGHTYPLSESNLFHPASSAGQAKLAEEEECVAFTRLHGLETVCLRYFNVFGPRQPHAALVPQIIKPMLLGRRPVIHGRGLEALELIFVSDVVHANLLALEAPRVAGRRYNIARGLPTTALEIVQIVNRLLDTRLEPILAAPSPRTELHNLANIARAESELGFCPSIDLEAGLQQCIDYYGGWRAELVEAHAR